MGVYFPNMKKPPNCSECPVKLDCGLYLGVPDGGINSNCPVIYVNSSHGRLIDAAVLINEFTRSAKAGRLNPWSLVKTAPAIIPAEGGGDDG
jgi:hypothetical protein